MARIIGLRKGDNGTDVAPEPNDGIEHSPYPQILICEPTGDVSNASKQKLWAVRCPETVRRLSNNTVALIHYLSFPVQPPQKCSVPTTPDSKQLLNRR